MPLTILFPDSRSSQLDIELEVTGPDVVLLNPRKDRFDAIEMSAWESCDGIVVARVPINATVIPHLKRTRIVVRNGVGFDVVDLKACGDAGIAVCNVPDYGTTEVADTAIGMMLTFARGTAALDAALRADLKSGCLRGPAAQSDRNDVLLSVRRQTRQLRECGVSEAATLKENQGVRTRRRESGKCR